MPFLPHLRLFVRPSIAVVLSGPHIQIIDPITGAVLHSTTRSNDGHGDGHDARRDSVVRSGPVRAAALDSSNACLATVSDDKKLRVWEVAGLKLLSERELPKSATDVKFTADGKTILVSDKFGDVFRYPLHPDTSPTKDTKKDPLASHENPWGTLVLGHVSFLTAFLLTHGEKYIITADRDEHIRVSWYPQGYNIETFCLGHKKFVSAIYIPDFAHDTLISGGGDPMIKMWDWKNGILKHEVHILGAVEPFIKVRRSRQHRRRPLDDKDAGDGDGEEDKGEKDARDDDSMQDVVLEHAQGKCEADGGGESSRASDEAALVLRRIASLQVGSDQRILFSAVGATALFSVSFLGSNTEVIPFDFGMPVIDFEIGADSSVWVLIDAQWQSTAAHGSGPPSMVKVVTWTGVKFVEMASNDVLLTSLNSACVLPASASEIADLDLYGSLVSLPKLAMPNDASDRVQKRERSEELSKRALGRLRNKEKLALFGSTGHTDEGAVQSEGKRGKQKHDSAPDSGP